MFSTEQTLSGDYKTSQDLLKLLKVCDGKAWASPFKLNLTIQALQSHNHTTLLWSISCLYHCRLKNSMSTNFYLMWLHLQVVGGSAKNREREIKSYC